jgi:hypothetical protein
MIAMEGWMTVRARIYCVLIEGGEPATDDIRAKIDTVPAMESEINAFGHIRGKASFGKVDALPLRGLVKGEFLAIRSDVGKSEILSPVKTSNLIHSRIKAEIFLALEFCVGCRHERENPNLVRLKAIEISKLPRHPNRVR